jgi:hypothetical protein
MAIKESYSGGAANHPSFQSSLLIVECDHCGREFRADVCVSDRYEYQGKFAGRRDYSTWTEQDLCAGCAWEALGAD